MPSTEYMGEGGGRGGCGHGGGREWGGFLCNDQKSLTCLPGMCILIYSARLYNGFGKSSLGTQHDLGYNRKKRTF